MVESELFVLDNSGGTHTGSNAHGDDTVVALLSLQFGEKSGDLTGTSASQGVAKSDGTSLRVDLVHVEAELLAREVSLRREGFVDFIDINVLSGQASLLEGFGDSVSGTNSYKIKKYILNG